MRRRPRPGRSRASIATRTPSWPLVVSVSASRASQARRRGSAGGHRRTSTGDADEEHQHDDRVHQRSRRTAGRRRPGSGRTPPGPAARMKRAEPGVQVAGVAQDRQHRAEGGGGEDQAHQHPRGHALLGAGHRDDHDAGSEPEDAASPPSPTQADRSGAPDTRDIWISYPARNIRTVSPSWENAETMTLSCASPRTAGPIRIPPRISSTDRGHRHPARGHVREDDREDGHHQAGRDRAGGLEGQLLGGHPRRLDLALLRR